MNSNPDEKDFFLNKFIKFVRPRKSLTEIPLSIAAAFVCSVIAVLAAVIICVVFSVINENPKINFGILIAGLLFIFVFVEYFYPFLYNKSSEVEGIVLSVPQVPDRYSIDLTAISKRITQEFKRLYFTLRDDNGVYYKIPCAANTVHFNVGDRVLVFLENGQIVEIASNSMKTPTAIFVQVLVEAADIEETEEENSGKND